MDQDFAHMVAASKVPMLKPENGATLPKTITVEGVVTVMPIITAEEKAQRRLELVSQLELLDEKLSQENVNQKLLRSLSPDGTYIRLEATTATRGGSFSGIVELQEMQDNKKQGKLKKACAKKNKKHLLPQLLCHVMVLVDMTGVIRQRNGLIMHSWLSHLQVLTQSSTSYTVTFMPPTPILSFRGLDEFVNEPVVEEQIKLCLWKKSLRLLVKREIVKSLKKKMYCLVVTDDYSRFTWVFFLDTKDETSGILMSFITRIENLVDHKVNGIRCDNRTEFKNREMNQFCEMKGILRKFSVARTPQQNGVAERRNRTTLIEATRTMLADSKLPTTFWAEAVNTACYVQNKVLVVKPHNKTPYELFQDRTPTLSFMRPFRCPVTILNTIYHLGKFDDKADEGFFVGYSLNNKAFRVFNSRTWIVEENLHIRFSESIPNVVGSGPDWIFDIDALTRTMNYEPIWAIHHIPKIQRVLMMMDQNLQVKMERRFLKIQEKDNECNDQEKEDNVNITNNVNNTNNVNTISSTVNTAGINEVNAADMNNLDTTIQVSPNPTTRIHKDHPLDQVIGDLQSATQTRKMSKNLKEHGFVSTIQQRTNHKDLQNCLFACFLSQEEPKKVIHALKDPSWIEAMQEELLQFKLQEVWTLVDLPNGKRAIGSKWVFRNKKDERGIVIRNKARLVA
ncbi:retrovirus-related pol polyprotein from transposon TNT 1-94 [Tanacetum coccineum]